MYMFVHLHLHLHLRLHLDFFHVLHVRSLVCRQLYDNGSEEDDAQVQPLYYGLWFTDTLIARGQSRTQDA